MKVDMHRMFIRQYLFVLLLLPTAYGANAEDLKVHISADMEGVAGAVDRAQMGPSGFEYGQFRKFMTAMEIARRLVNRFAIWNFIAISYDGILGIASKDQCFDGAEDVDVCK